MKTIFDETRLGALRLKNRVFRSATWMAMTDESGLVNDELVNYYGQLAAGGVGTIITGITSVYERDAEVSEGAKFYDDRFIAGHRLLTDAVHRHDCRLFLQTAMIDYPVDAIPTEEVERIIAAFGDAAHRAEQAGYDGVQIHAAHFFYLSKFVSPLLNHRTDRFGGSIERRAQILLDILRNMRSKTSDAFSIIIKMNYTDRYPGGVGLEDFLTTGRLLAEFSGTSGEGRMLRGIDAIEVSANGTSVGGIRAGVNEASFLPAARALAETVSVPVILVGGLRSLETMNSILNDTRIEYLSLSRPLIREPQLLQRWLFGDTTPARCVSCNACYQTPQHQCIFNLRKKS